MIQKPDMNSIYDRNLANKTVSELIDLCRRCSPTALDGREFIEHKRRALEDFKRELLNRDPNKVIDNLVDELLTQNGSVL